MNQTTKNSSMPKIVPTRGAADASSARVSIRKRVEQIMAEKKVDEKAALKKAAKERGVSKSEAYRELQRSK